MHIHRRNYEYEMLFINLDLKDIIRILSMFYNLRYFGLAISLKIIVII